MTRQTATNFLLKIISNGVALFKLTLKFLPLKSIFNLITLDFYVEVVAE
jgi:hypothetical protein